MIDHVGKRIKFRYNDPIAYYKIQCIIIYTGVVGTWIVSKLQLDDIRSSRLGVCGGKILCQAAVIDNFFVHK